MGVRRSGCCSALARQRRRTVSGHLVVVVALWALAGAAAGQEAPLVRQDPPDETVGPGERVTIQVGMLGAYAFMGAHDWFEEEIRRFMAAHPSIEVEPFALTYPMVPYHTARSDRPIDTIPGLPANVLGVVGSQGYETAYLVQNEFLVPIDAFLPDPDFRLSDFYDNLWDSVRYEGKLWGVPWQHHVIMLACHALAFETEGLSPPGTWDEFMECARRLTKDVDRDGHIDQWGCCIHLHSAPHLAMAMLLEKGVPLVTREGLDVSDPRLLEVLSFVQGLTTAEFNITRTPPAPGTYAMVFGFFGQDYEEFEQGFDDVGIERLIIAPVPSFGDTPAAWDVQSLYLSIRASSPEKERASWEFVKWIALHGGSVRFDAIEDPCNTESMRREDLFGSLTRLSRKDDFCKNVEVWFESVSRIRAAGVTQARGTAAALTSFWLSLTPVLMGDTEVTRAEIVKAAAEANKLIHPMAIEERNPYELYK